MTQYQSFLIGCVIASAVFGVVNIILRKKPEKADLVIDYIMYFVLGAMLAYSIYSTDFTPVEEKLDKQLKEYKDTQRRVHGLA